MDSCAVIVGARFAAGGVPCGHPRAAHVGTLETVGASARVVWRCSPCADDGRPERVAPDVAGAQHRFSDGAPLSTVVKPRKPVRLIGDPE